MDEKGRSFLRDDGKNGRQRAEFSLESAALHDLDLPALEAAFEANLPGVDQVGDDERGKLFILSELRDGGDEVGKRRLTVAVRGGRDSFHGAMFKQAMCHGDA